MKKLFFILILSLELCGYSQNVSTGVDASGNSLAAGSIDSWQIVSSPNPLGTAALVSNYYPGYWELSPVLTTNAGWINPTGAYCCSNLSGIYTFEKTFTVAYGSSYLSYNFSIAWDDELISLELVKPDLTTIPITVVPGGPYHLSSPILDNFTNPMSGIWKIRAKINFVDQAAAFLLSGNVTVGPPCDKWTLCGNAITPTDFLGTTNNQPLTIKTNNIQRAIVTASGEMGVGTSTPLHKFHVNDGALMLSGTVPGFGGPQLLFSDNVTTHPNGRWAIEYLTADSSRPSMGGLNFWTPFNPGGGSGTAGNYSLFLKDDGKIGMGVTDDSTDSKFCASALPTGYRLYVNGGILTTKVKVANYCSTAWADYVFANDYKLKPLSEVETFVKENKHLPNIPSASEIEKEGLDLADMQSKQMGKIEELTLYMIEMKKEIEILKMETSNLKVAMKITSK